MTVFVIVIIISLSISFLCSLMEACLLSLSTTDIAAIAEKKPFIAKIWQKYKERIQAPIAVILIINTLAHTIGASISGAKFDELFGNKWLIVFSIAYSFIMIQWTELLPKTLGVKFNRPLAVISAVPFKILIKIFSPFIIITNALNRPFDSKKYSEKKLDALSEISVLARFAVLNNVISTEQEQIVSRSMQLSNVKVKNIMINKDDVKWLSTDMSLMEALIEAHLHHHTRFPLVEGKNINNIIGYVNFKDIVSALQVNPQNPTLKGICRPIIELQNEEKLTDVMKKLTQSYQHIAVIKNKKYETAGFITMEDVIETIIGNINDEYDVLPEFFYPIAENRYLAGGGIPLSTVNSFFSVELKKTEKSLNDYLMHELKQKPTGDEVFRNDGLKFIIRKVRRNRIYEVIIEKENNPS